VGNQKTPRHYRFCSVFEEFRSSGFFFVMKRTDNDWLLVRNVRDNFSQHYDRMLLFDIMSFAGSLPLD